MNQDGMLECEDLIEVFMRFKSGTFVNWPAITKELNRRMFPLETPKEKP